MKKLLTIAVVLLVVSVARPVPAFDLSVAHLEITQAIQDATNSIALITGRSTAVRVKILTDGASPFAGVTGKLHVKNGGTAIPGSPFSPVNPLSFQAQPAALYNSEVENHTLNFELLSSTVALPVTAALEFTFEIAPVPASDTNSSNNSKSVTVKVVDRIMPQLFFTRIIYVPVSATDYADDSLVLPAASAGAGDAVALGMMPLKDSGPPIYQEGPFPKLHFGYDPSDPGILNEGAETTKLNDLLNSCRQFIVNNGYGADNRTFLYGWFKGNPLEKNASSYSPQRIAFGNTDPLIYQRSFAHELGHLFGVCHHNRCDPCNPNCCPLYCSTNPVNWGASDCQLNTAVGWDVAKRLPGHPSANNVTGQVKKKVLYDFMKPYSSITMEPKTASVWINPITYKFYVESGIYSNPTGPDPRPDDDYSAEVLVVRGAFDPAGATLLSLERVFRFPWLSQPFPEPDAAPYRVLASGGGDAVERRFDAVVSFDDEATPEERGFFSVMVPFDGPVNLLRILDTAGNVEYGRLERSPTAPTVSILSPVDGENLGDPVTIAWSGSDPDMPSTDLEYQVAYSPDGGQSFVPLAVNLFEAAVTVETTPIPEGAGTGLIRVFASDGLNTSYADVGNLTVLGNGNAFQFIRGDADGDGELAITDAIAILGHLFLGEAGVKCRAAADVSRQGDVNITSAVYLLSHLFLGGAAPPSPYPSCAGSRDPVDRGFGCETSPCP